MMVSAAGEVQAGIRTKRKPAMQSGIRADLVRQSREILHIKAAPPRIVAARSKLQARLRANLSHRASGKKAEGRRAAGHARNIAIQRMLQLSSLRALRFAQPKCQRLTEFRR